MKKRTFIMGLAALALAFGSAGVIGGVALNTNDGAIMTKAAVGDDIKIGEGTYKEIYRTGFENATTGTNYKGTQKYAASVADGLDWTIYYGTVSKNDKISGNNSAQIRLYKDKNCGFMTNTSALDTSVDAIQFTYAVSNKSVTFNVDYSTDGTVWNTIESVSPASTSSATYTHEFSESVTNFRLRIVVTGGFPSKDNYTFRVDDVIFAKDATKRNVDVENGSNVALTTGNTKELALKAENLPEGGLISAEVADSSIASIALSETAISIKGLSVGETTYTVVMKDADSNIVASYTGNISVTVGVTDVTLSSTFSNGDTLRIGNTYALNTTVSPSTASQEVVWTVSDSNAVTISSENVLSVVKKTGTDAITITATSVADSTKSATLSFYVGNEFAISELVSQDGSKLPNGLISGSSVVSTKGTVTAIEGNNVFIQSGDAAIELFANKDKSLNSLKVGDGVKASGTITLYNGVVELTSPSATVDSSIVNDVTPVELGEDVMISSNVSRLVTAHNAICLESKTISGSGNISVSFKLSDETAVSLYFKSSSISKLSSFGNFIANNSYEITGLYNVFGTTKQILMVEGCSYYAAGTEEVKQFIADYIAGKDGVAAEGDTCKAKYDAAKAAYDKLSDNARTLFTTNSDYASAYETYTYWETHQNDASAVKLVNGSNTTNWTNIAVIAGAILLASCASVYFFLNKKKQDR